jgi:CspA family cold shock protein
VKPNVLIPTLHEINFKKMSKGTVKFFNESKGFGFIKDDASDKEYFVHVSGLNDQVRENDEVTFDLQDGKKGLNAVNVKLA